MVKQNFYTIPIANAIRVLEDLALVHQFGDKFLLHLNKFSPPDDFSLNLVHPSGRASLPS